MSTFTQYETEAWQRGVDAARNAASWAVDGNTDTGHIRRVLAMLDDGDPQAFDYLPRTPDLSGEFADDPTPLSLARDCIGDDCPSADVIDACAQAFEDAVSETFATECESVMREYVR